MFKKYSLGFDVWALMLFLIIMLPNFIWFACPAPNDILRTDSITKTADAFASVCQVLMIASLCIFKNKHQSKIRLTPLILSVIICCLLYIVMWICYYAGAVNITVIFGLTLLPCLAFMLFAIDRKNMIAIAPISVFTVCHLIYAIVNFVI